MPSTTTFRSDESFTPRTFRRRVDARPMSDVKHYELVRGRIVTTPPAGWTHASVGARIVGLLDAPPRVSKPTAPRVRTSTCGRCPVLSPGTSVRDRTEKKDLYEQNGVDEYWVVDSDHRTVTIFTREPPGYGAGRTAIGGTLRSRVLPKLRVSLAKLFED